MSNTLPTHISITVALTLVFSVLCFNCVRYYRVINPSPDGGGAKDTTSFAETTFAFVDRGQGFETTINDGQIDAGRRDSGKRDAANIDAGRRDAGKRDAANIDAGRRDAGKRDAYVVPGTWVNIAAGTFQMGSPPSDPCYNSVETRHQVTLTHPFEISITEVTREQFQNVRGYQPAYFSCANCPVELVNWHEAAAYCNTLSVNRGYVACYNCLGAGSNVTCLANNSYGNGNIYLCPGYRLPTEAEWEYAYRAGSTTTLYNNTNVIECINAESNLGGIAWYYYNEGSSTRPVAGKTPNAWGLYDMAGNVWEWTNDFWDGTSAYATQAVTNPWGQTSGAYRVDRGGSWANAPYHERAADRGSFVPTEKNNKLGLRCVRSK